MSAAVALEDASFGRSAGAVLTAVNLRIEAGERVALLGPSGAGKTTLLRLILGLEAPSHGIVRLGDRIASRDGQVLVPPEERRLGIVFQDLALWPHLTVWHNLAFGLRARGISHDEQHARIAAVIERLGMHGKDQRHPGELSGGERQRVAIARALVLQPDAILLDEPLANLDVQLKRELLTLLRELFAQRQCSVLYVSHDLREAAALGDRIVVLEQGRVVQDGTLAELRTQPRSEFVRALLDDT
jgi:iron(III) transport system ATP-binding protein